ncbi:hypothetical protein M409DRAFT_65806 [Zasmidium cellare ATCC 36951]|uniref:Uncharacterized protein n=1 Tax=Zasmidium cellare ATCC 36951 TaxID=1080233 RepID=A0A6A6CKV0_ZASCE|nr:uncharacterized protein M409DRAFT_65806 [Zasmidium cellare ATCC 36951]KAF2167671.1 hypothetical protein M409DRAFT_65806 [Zasmidium cellare ATCC 36951]
MASLRSSTRTTPRKTYTVDAFEGIRDLIQHSSESDDGAQQGEQEEGDEMQEEEDESEEDEFKSVAAESGPDDESMSGLDELGPVEEADDRASDAGEADLDDSMSIVEDIGPSNRTTTMKRNRVKKVLPPEGERTYVRGIPTDLHSHVNKAERYKWLFGPTKDDQQPVIKARNKWTNKRGLPSRTPYYDDRGGFAYRKTYRTETENAESNWKWYREGGGREAFERRQVMKALTFNEVLPYLPTDFKLRTFVMGPVSRRKFYSMKVRQWVSLSAAFAKERQTQSNGEASKSSSSSKKGFILNLGAKVQSLDWAPNQGGPKQYLAATVLPFNRADNPSDARSAPSFTPQRPHRSSIQIWEISATSDDLVDDTVPPRLSIVLCTAIGELKAIKWCPVPHKDSERLGLLACVSSDGAIRVLDVPPPGKDARTSNLLVEDFAFECRPPDTVCTALTWISSSRLAAACANGFVAIWDLNEALQSGKTNSRPTTYTGISTSYIMSITSCYPSFPHMIATTSMNGFVTLMDSRQPHPNSRAATTQTNRTRIGQSLIMWHDFAHAGVSVEDNQTVRCYPLRKWFTGLATAKLKGHVTSMAVSLCHPYVLTGSAAGEVAGHNPVRRLVDGAKSLLYQQRWFTHEWRRPTEDEREAAEMAEIEPASGNSNEVDVQSIIGKDGLSRITDGFKPQVAVLNNYGAANVKDGALFSTIYEEKSAVTALAWNPNLHVGGWAAAGMADGLLKVEDVAF